MSTFRVSNSQSGVGRKKVMIAHELRQMCSPDDGSAVGDGGKRGKAERHKLINRGDESQQDEQDVHVHSCAGRSSQRSHRSCVHVEVPPMFRSSFLFLDKPLFISFIDLKNTTIEKPVLFRSTLSVRLGVSSRTQPTRRDEAPVAAQGQQPGGRTLQRTVPVCYVTGTAGDPDPRRHGNAPGLSSLRRPKPSNAKTGERKKNADEFRREPLTPNLDPGMNFITSPLERHEMNPHCKAHISQMLR